MTTQELFDCSIDEMGLNARTRGALKRVGSRRWTGSKRRCSATKSSRD
jgi:hypothetical protein